MATVSQDNDPNDPDQQRRQALLAGLADPNALGTGGNTTAPATNIPAPITSGGNTTQPGPGTPTTPTGSGANPGSQTFQSTFGGSPTDANYLKAQQTLYNPGGLQSQYDAAGSDPAKQFAAYLAGNPGNPQTAIDQWNATGDTTLKPAWESGSRTIGLANGTYLVAPGTGGNTGTGWQTVTRGPEGAAGAGGAGAAGPGVDPAQAAFAQKLRDSLLGQIDQLSQPESATSSDIQPAIQAFTNQSTRDQQRVRDQLAEVAYAKSAGGNPLDSGGFNLAAQQAAEAGANDRANFTGTTVANANTARRQALLSSLGAGLQEQGLGQQNTQFNDSLAEMYAALLANMNQTTATAGLTGA